MSQETTFIEFSKEQESIGEMADQPVIDPNSLTGLNRQEKKSMTLRDNR